MGLRHRQVWLGGMQWALLQELRPGLVAMDGVGRPLRPLWLRPSRQRRLPRRLPLYPALGDQRVPLCQPRRRPWPPQLRLLLIWMTRVLHRLPGSQLAQRLLGHKSAFSIHDQMKKAQDLGWLTMALPMM